MMSEILNMMEEKEFAKVQLTTPEYSPQNNKSHKFMAG